jgi:ribosomal protection tetracycline resistance protein
MPTTSNIIRILVDGYSLSHHWKDIEPGKPRFSEAVRNSLIKILRQFQDSHGVPLTLVFDASAVTKSKRSAEIEPNTRNFEIIYSEPGQSADEVIERVTHRLSGYGPVVAVTNDRAEQETVRAMGGHAVHCEEFITQVKRALSSQKTKILEHNRKEVASFKQSASKRNNRR